MDSEEKVGIVSETIDKIKAALRGRGKLVSVVSAAGVVVCVAAAALFMGLTSTSTATGADGPVGSANPVATAPADTAPPATGTPGPVDLGSVGDGSNPVPGAGLTNPDAPLGADTGESDQGGGTGSNGGGSAGSDGGTSFGGVLGNGQPQPGAPSNLDQSTLTPEQLAQENAAGVASHTDDNKRPGAVTAKRSADEALPPVVLGAQLVDSTDYLMPGFGADLDTRQSFKVSMSKDSCLLDWANATLPTMNGVGKAYTTSACGRTAAVIVGGYTTSGRDMILRALYSQEHASLKSVLFGAPALQYASVASSDGKAILIVLTSSPG